ncbi:hypothetical protein GX656_03610 [Candidatus Dojkabacteria bacterium]|uniref:Uncharacterized protein n=1 Tax=Candidatus Dojkabacteria bacterium TaxID=2099670 RepID=A0A847D1G7_9BACT|nr:hypothetical protein [Candidatus Dojkabacteria bacterium]
MEYVVLREQSISIVCSPHLVHVLKAQPQLLDMRVTMLAWVIETFMNQCAKQDILVFQEDAEEELLVHAETSLIVIVHPPQHRTIPAEQVPHIVGYAVLMVAILVIAYQDHV